MDKKTRISDATVRNVAVLSRLRLSPEEVNIYGRQLTEILGYIETLNKLNIDDVPPTSHPLEKLKNVFRKDFVKESLPIEQVLRNAPGKKENFFSVPKIIE